MKTFAAIATTIALAASGSAFAQKPVPMTDAQMDKVVGGALITVVAVDVLDVNNVLNNNQVTVSVPVNAAVAVAVLGQATSVAQQRVGAISQR